MRVCCVLEWLFLCVSANALAALTVLDHACPFVGDNWATQIDALNRTQRAPFFCLRSHFYRTINLGPTGLGLFSVQFIFLPQHPMQSHSITSTTLHSCFCRVPGVIAAGRGPGGGWWESSLRLRTFIIFSIFFFFLLQLC